MITLNDIGKLYVGDKLRLTIKVQKHGDWEYGEYVDLGKFSFSTFDNVFLSDMLRNSKVEHLDVYNDELEVDVVVYID